MEQVILLSCFMAEDGREMQQWANGGLFIKHKILWNGKRMEWVIRYGS
jgi:hypothetical protein